MRVKIMPPRLHAYKMFAGGGIRKKGRMRKLSIRPFAMVWRWVVPIETDLFIERAAAS